MSEEIALTAYQQRCMMLPEQWDTLLGGGRRGGKTRAELEMVARHVRMYGRRAKVLILRKTHKGLSEIIATCREVFGNWFGGVNYNGSELVFRFPNGATVELGQLQTLDQYTKYQGHTYTLIVVDEAGQYADPLLIDRMRSNLSGPPKMPTRLILSANPGGSGHSWLAKRYVTSRKPWEPFVEDQSKRTWVYAPSIYTDNTFLDQEQYLTQIEAATQGNEDLLKAWRDGDWDVSVGAFFAQVLEEKRVMVEAFTEVPRTYGQRWEHWLCHDWGQGAPSVTYLLAKSPGAEANGRYFPRGSVVAIAEMATVKRGSLNEGTGWNAAKVGEEILARICKPFDVRPSMVVDDAAWNRTGMQAGTIIDEFERVGLHCQRAHKGRRAPGWQIMSRMFADAVATGKYGDKAGLYIARNLRYFWETVPFLNRDQWDLEDIDTDEPDHGADSLRYGLIRIEYVKTINLRLAY